MTKKQYLTKLKNGIQGLPLDEQKEALDYYSDYLDEAEDLQTAFEELGSPEELAQSIVDKITCVPAKVKKAKSNSNQSGQAKEEFENTYYSDIYDEEKLSYNFKTKMVKNLGIAVGTGNVVIKSGSEYKVETRGLSESDIRCEVNSAGTLIIENRKGFPKKKNHDSGTKSYWEPRILITVPENCKLENFKLTVEAGKLSTKKLSLSSNRTMIDVRASNVQINGVSSNASIINCSMANLKFKGSLKGLSKISCNMGAIKIDLDEPESKVSYQASVSLGSAKFNQYKIGGLKENFVSRQKENHLVIVSRVGEVKVITSDF